MNHPSDPSPWSGPRRRPGRWILAGLLLAGAGLLFLPPVKRKILTVIDRLRTERVITKTETVEKIVEKQVEEAAPPAPLPNGPSLGTKKDVAAIFGGITLESNLITGEGRRATLERNDAASYAVEFNFKIKVPVPARTLEDFMGINPEIPVLIPGFKDLLTSAKVSGFFHYQYQQKQNFLQANILRLDRVLSRHNFYDLESVLELENAATKQKALLLQGEMDVVSDGSDGDRMDSFDDYIFKSQHFQPTTSYAWEKTTAKQNPLIPRLEADLKGQKEKLKAGGLSDSEKAGLQERIKGITRTVADLKRRSFLIGQEDPFIVIPMSFRNYRTAYAFGPDIGDYAVVICGNKMMPAIVGDYGPAVKTGEASLRIAREIDPKCGPYNRPVSDLKVTYLIFPGSAAKKTSAPDYAAWHRQCGELLTKLGGNAGALHQWQDRLKPAAVTPAATPAATPAVAVPVPAATPQ